MSFEITQNNCKEYLETYVSDYLPFKVQGIKSAEEVTEQTYVNWIFRVVLITEDGDRTLYLRQTRDRVKGKPDMRMEPSRIGFEVKVLNLLQGIQPNITPKVFFVDLRNNIAILEDIKRDGAFLVDELLAGNTHPETGNYFGKVVAVYHGKTFGINHREVRGSFQANEEALDFHLGMRLKPALEFFPDETKKLLRVSKKVRSCLVLGDLASKNIFVDDGIIRFLDLERAFVGDPAFDLAFLFCHYLIEVPETAIAESVNFINNFISSYRSTLNGFIDASEIDLLENRVIRFLGITILYRLFGFYLVVKVERDNMFWKTTAHKLLIDEKSYSLLDALRFLLKDYGKNG